MTKNYHKINKNYILKFNKIYLIILDLMKKKYIN